MIIFLREEILMEILKVSAKSNPNLSLIHIYGFVSRRGLERPNAEGKIPVDENE